MSHTHTIRRNGKEAGPRIHIRRTYTKKHTLLKLQNSAIALLGPYISLAVLLALFYLPLYVFWSRYGSIPVWVNYGVMVLIAGIWGPLVLLILHRSTILPLMLVSTSSEPGLVDALATAISMIGYEPVIIKRSGRHTILGVGNSGPKIIITALRRDRYRLDLRDILFFTPGSSTLVKKLHLALVKIIGEEKKVGRRE